MGMEENSGRIFGLKKGDGRDASGGGRETAGDGGGGG